MNKNCYLAKRNEWVIHIWGKKRDELKLTFVEKFHLELLKKYRDNFDKFDRILVNIAMDDVNDKKLFNFIKSKLKKVISTKNVEVKCCQNIEKKSEYVTFRPYVFDRIGEDVNILYTHFKGYASSCFVNRDSFPKRIVNLCEMFWSYMMYEYSFNFNDVQDKLKDKCVYCWFVWKRNKILDDYFYIYHKRLRESNQIYAYYAEDDFCKHSPGSFVWYNCKRIGEELKNKPEIIKANEEDFGENLVYTHFCELYLMQYLKEDECYSVNDFSNEWMKLKSTAYVRLYPLKTIGKELIGEFDKYLIENKLI